MTPECHPTLVPTAKYRKMIYELRTYRLKTGATSEYIRRVKTQGIEIQKRHLGHLIGYFTTELGPLNQVVHIWAYEDLQDRADRRARLASDAEWLAFVPCIQELIEAMDTRIMTATPFSPLQ